MRRITALSSLIALALAFASVGTAARAIEPEDIPMSDDYIVRTWEMDDGLPSNRIYDIAQTPDGYLWLGTQGGLVRFDGVHFTALTARNASGLSEDRVHALYVSRDGALWIGQAGGRVTRKLEATFQEIRPAPEAQESADRVTSFAQSKDGAVWFTYERSARVSRWRGGEMRDFGGAEGVPEGSAGWICCDRDDHIWYANSSGCAVLDGQRFRAVDPAAASGARITAAARGGIWATRGGHLMHYTADGSQEIITTVGNISVHGLFEDSIGTLWIQTNQSGLIRFGTDGSVRVPIAGASVSVVFEDREKNLWVGRQSGGLNRVRLRRFFLHQAKEGVAEDEIYSAAQDAEGRVWLSGRANMLVRATDAQNRHFATPLGWHNEVAARGITADANGGVLIATANGVRRCSHDAWAEELPEENSASVLIDRRGEVWITTPGGSLYITRKKDPPTPPFTSAMGHVSIAAEDLDGTLWIGTEEGSIYRRRGEHWDAIALPNAEPGAVLFIVGDQGHAVWFAVGNRIYRWRADQVRPLPASADFPGGDLRSLAITDEGEFWIGTARGLILTERGELEAALEHGRTAWFRSFGRDDGVPMAEFSPANRGAVTRTRDGHLWFATDRGALEIVPHQITAPKVIGSVRIEEITVGDQAVAFGKTHPVAIAPRAGPIRIRYTLPQMNGAEEIAFRYRLRGPAGDEWLSVGTARVATLAGLPPGVYRFEVQATDAGGRPLASEPAVLPFTIAAWWWQKPLTRVAGAAIALVLLSLAVRKVVLLRVRTRLRRLEQERAVERERTRIARDMHDQLGASLTQIAIASKLLVLDPPERVANHGREIAAIARHTIESLDEIVWAVDPANDGLGAALDYLVGFAVEFLASAGIASDVQMPEDVPETLFPARTRHHLFLAVRESLNNIVKHAAASLVHLEITIRSSRLTINIADNGRGFDPGPTRAGASGLTNIQARMAEIGGACRLESSSGAGTRIELTVDLVRRERKDATE